jgi:DNA-binding transcriptional LysR family regulator
MVDYQAGPDKLSLNDSVSPLAGIALDTELLRTFLEVRTTRHFGRAAQNLFITQAAVSARIKQLEETLGATLFIRNRNNIQLSSEGERLVPHAEAVLMALVRARHDLALEDVGSCQIHLGVRTGIWGAALQQKLHALQDAEPDLVMRLDSREPADLTRKLMDRTLDMAILYEPPSLPELKCVPIGELTLKLFSSAREHSLADAMAGNYVYLDWGGGFSRFHSRRFGDSPLPVLHTNLNAMASDYLVARGGACYLPASLEASLGTTGLWPVADAPDFSRQLNVAYHSGSAQRELIVKVAGYFRDLEV